MSVKKVHLLFSNRPRVVCGIDTSRRIKHIGGCLAYPFENFLAFPEEQRCVRCNKIAQDWLRLREKVKKVQEAVKQS